MGLDRVSLTDMNDNKPESIKQDQTARMCRLILLYTLREIKSIDMNVRKRVNKSCLSIILWSHTVHSFLRGNIHSYMYAQFCFTQLHVIQSTMLKYVYGLTAADFTQLAC